MPVTTSEAVCDRERRDRGKVLFLGFVNNCVQVASVCSEDSYVGAFRNWIALAERCRITICNLYASFCPSLVIARLWKRLALSSLGVGAPLKDKACLLLPSQEKVLCSAFLRLHFGWYSVNLRLTKLPVCSTSLLWDEFILFGEQWTFRNSPKEKWNKSSSFCLATKAQNVFWSGNVAWELSLAKCISLKGFQDRISSN